MYHKLIKVGPGRGTHTITKGELDSFPEFV